MAAQHDDIGQRAASALSLRIGASLSAPVGDRPLALAWRARRADASQGGDDPTRALFVARPDAPEAERRRYVQAAERVSKASGLTAGVLRVHAVAPAAEAYVTDLWTLGSAKDLGALGWPAARRADFVRKVAEGLETLHGAGIVHGCLCEENVLLDDDLAPVLAEAGAVSVHALSERGGDAASYIAFAAPEVIEGADGDARSDVYALGRLLQHVVRADDLPQATEVIRRCVAPAPAGRYPSAAAVATAIAGLVAAIGVEKQPGAVAPRPPLAAARADTGPPGPMPSGTPSTRPVPPPSWLGPAGAGMGIVAIVVALLGIGSSNGTQTTLSVLLVGGVAMGAMALRPSPRTPQWLRVGFALGLAALVAVGDPLAYAYRSAAERAVRASPEARRTAVEQIIRLGRDFQNMSLADVDLSGTDLRGADLRGADLSRSDLSHASLLGAMLAGASLAEAKLAGADLRQTDLDRAHFAAAICDDKTMLPEPIRCVAGSLTRASTVAVVRAAEPASAVSPALPPSLEGGVAPR